MMKKLFIILIICFTSLSSFAQEKNEFLVYYGMSDSKLLRTDDLIGGGSEEIENLTEYGFRYLRKINDRLAIETGVNYATADLKITPHYMGEPVQTRAEDFELISIPVYANYTIWNYFFINGGPMVDFQLSETTTDSQSGIGYGLGLGGKYNFNNFSIYLNPNFKRHAVIPFEKEQNHQKLTEFGIQFGLGYSF
jgi:hypothetical protein